MSTKTSIKRIALVAVSALGFGLLSVMPASAEDENDATAIAIANTTTDDGVALTSAQYVSNPVRDPLQISQFTVGAGSSVVLQVTAVGGTGDALSQASKAKVALRNATTSYGNVVASEAMADTAPGAERALTAFIAPEIAGTYFLDVTVAPGGTYAAATDLTTTVTMIVTGRTAMSSSQSVVGVQLNGLDGTADVNPNCAAGTVTRANLDADNTIFIPYDAAGTGATTDAFLCIVVNNANGAAITNDTQAAGIDVTVVTSGIALVANNADGTPVTVVSDSLDALDVVGTAVTGGDSDGDLIFTLSSANSRDGLGGIKVTIDDGTTSTDYNFTVKFYHSEVKKITLSNYYYSLSSSTTAAATTDALLVEYFDRNDYPMPTNLADAEIKTTPDINATADLATLVAGTAGTALTGAAIPTATRFVGGLTGQCLGQTGTYTVTYKEDDAAVLATADETAGITSNAVTLSCSGSATALTIDNTTVTAGGVVTVTVKGTDSGGRIARDGVSVTLTPSGGSVVSSSATFDNGEAEFRWVVPLNDGTYSLAASTGSAAAGTLVTAQKTITVGTGTDASTAAANAASDAAAEAIDAANAATDAANLAAEAADAATVAAEEARDAADAATAAVEALATEVATLMAALKAQITTLANTVAKIAKKVKA